MTPEPDASASPPEPASVPASTPAAPSAPERRAVEALVAGAAGLILGRVLLGRAGGLATGLAAFGAGLLGKCPPPAPPRPGEGTAPEDEAPGTNGHAPPAAAAPPSRHSAPVPLPLDDAVPMRVRLETSPIPPVDAAAALTRAELAGSTLFAPITAQPLVPPTQPLAPPENVFAPPPATTPEPEEAAPAGPDEAAESAAEAVSLAAAAAASATANAGSAATEAAAFAAAAGIPLSIAEIFGAPAPAALKAPEAQEPEEEIPAPLEHPEASAMVDLPEFAAEPEAPAAAALTTAPEPEDVLAAALSASPAEEEEAPAAPAAALAEPAPVSSAEDPEDAGAFAEIPALFAPPEIPVESPEPELSFRAARPATAPVPGIEPLPLAALLEQAETELETPPPPDAPPAPAPKARTAPVLPVEAAAEVIPEPPPAAAQTPRLASAPVPLAVTEAAVGTLAEAVARAAAATSPVPPVTVPQPGTSPVPPVSRIPTGRTAPVPGLLDELPIEFAELKPEQEPGPRGDFLLVPEETPQSLPPLAPVVAALNVPLTDSDPVAAAAALAAAAPEFPSVSEEVPSAAPAPPAWPDMAEEEPLAEGEIPEAVFAEAVRVSTAPVPAVPESAPVPLPAVAASPTSPVPAAEALPPLLSGALISDPGWSADPPPAAVPAQDAVPGQPLSWAGAAAVSREPTAAVPVFQEMAAPPVAVEVPPAPAAPATLPPWGLPHQSAPMAEPFPADASLDDVPPFPAAPAFVTLPAAIARPATTPVAPILLPAPATAPVPVPVPVPATAPVIPVALGGPAAPVVPPVPAASEPVLENALPFPAAPAAAPWTIDPAGAPVVPPPPPETFAVPLGPVPPVPPPARHTTGPFPGESVSGPESPSSFVLHRSAEPSGSVYTPPYPIPMAAPVSPPPPSGSPEEIWRQAVAELSAFRSQAAPGAPAFPPPVGVPGGVPGAFPPVAGPPVLPPQPAAEPPAAVLPPLPGAPPAAPPAELPPWLKNAPAPEPAPAAAPDEADLSGPNPAKQFLPTIRLAVPQKQQTNVPRRPVPLSSPPLSTAAVVHPSPLPGYKAESLTGAVPPGAVPENTAPPGPETPPAAAVEAPEMPVVPNIIPAVNEPPAAEAVESPPATLGSILSSLPAMVAEAPGPAAPPRPATAPALPPLPQPPAGAPPSAAVPAVPVSGDKLYVDRQKNPRSGGKVPANYRKSTLTPARVVAVILLALAALALAYKDSLIPWFRRVWEQRILGRIPTDRTNPEATEPVRPAEGADVKVVPDTKKAPPITNKPAVPPAKPAASPAPAATPMPDTEPLPPPPAVTPAANDAPLPATEAGARDLISRLLYATTSAQVSPWILDSARIAPGLENYFASGKQVPVSSHVSTLSHTEKNPATNRSMWEFKVVTDTVEGGFPVLVEETKDGLRVNWDLLSQCRDLQFQKWAADGTAPPGRFYLGLERRHPFADMLPGQDHTRFMAFAVRPPILGEPSVFVFIPLNSPLAARAGKLFPFTGSDLPTFAPVLELEHRNGHIEVTAIVKENWRAVEPAKK